MTNEFVLTFMQDDFQAALAEAGDKLVVVDFTASKSEAYSFLQILMANAM